MISITEKTLQDLQFPTVLETISEICNTDIGKQKALEIDILSGKLKKESEITLYPSGISMKVV